MSSILKGEPSNEEKLAFVKQWVDRKDVSKSFLEKYRILIGGGGIAAILSTIIGVYFSQDHEVIDWCNCDKIKYV